MKSKNFIIFSSIDWDINWQLHHELVTSLLEEGSKILFIENTGTRNLRFTDLSRVFSRIKKWFYSKKGYKIINKNFLLYSPLILPFPYNKISTIINSYLTTRSIRNWIKNTGNGDICFISFLPTPLVYNVFSKINSIYKIYYCADDMTRSNTYNVKKIHENNFIKNVDAVFCTSHNLFDKCKKFNGSTYLIPSGVNFLKFKKIYDIKNNDLKIKKIYKTPIIGYIGAITKVFDKKLLVYLSKSFPDYTFLIIGKEHTDLRELKTIENIKFIGHVDHDSIPHYLKIFDIAIIPYLKNDFTENVYSFKLNEYLAMGLPVITTDLNEFKIFENQYPNTIYVSKSHKEFKNYLSRDFSIFWKYKQQRIEVAKENSWSNRFSKIKEIFEFNYNSNISSFIKKKENEQFNYLKSKSVISYFIIPLLVLYFITFHSPFFYYLSKGLEENYLIKKADAIVVFSGDGYSGYENLGFQKRTLDVLKYYKSGYADKIYVSSGKEQKISQVEIIKALLIQNKVKEKDIKIFTTYPSSTYENVIMVEKQLVKDEINEIIFITAPFHAKRSSLIWKKNAPQIKIYFAEPLDRKYKSSSKFKLNEIKVVLYEYLAIVYNFFKGRL